MIQTNLYSVSSHMPFDLNNNEDRNHHHPLFNTNIHQPFSSSSLSYSILFNENQDHGGSCSGEPNHIQSDHLKVDKFVPSSGSWDQEVEKDDKVWKKEDGNDNFEVDDINQVKWMPSKKRIIQRMMKDQRGSERKYDKQKRLVSYEGTNTSSNNNSSNNNTVRVCTDCHTTKTPVWRSGPTGPQSLCNACGIRQRRARHAFGAAATSANGESSEEKPYVKGKKMQIKRKRSKSDQCAPQLKRKGKIGNKCTSFEDLITSLSDNLASYQGFPQDEKDAAILLMALSSGLPHG